jgi:hypothetical protein
MTSTPLLNRILFIAFVLLSICVGVAALIWQPVRSLSYAPLRDVLLPDFYLNPQAGKPVALLVAVPPALEDWFRDSAAEFASQNPRVSVNVTVMRGAEAGTRLTAITGLPDIWIAESDWTRTAAGGILFEETGTVIAQDTFVWAAGANSAFSAFDWRSVAGFASTDPQFRLAIPPEGSVEGMGACLSSAAEFFGQPSLSAAQINDPSFRRFLAGIMEAVPDRTRNPFDQMASRPPQADMAFLPMSDGRRLNPSAFVLQTPAYRAVFNYTLYLRSNWSELEGWEADVQRDAAERLRAFLLGGPQGKLDAHSLEKADGVFEQPARPADENAVYALRFCWKK